MTWSKRLAHSSTNASNISSFVQSIGIRLSRMSLVSIPSSRSIVGVGKKNRWKCWNWRCNRIRWWYQSYRSIQSGILWGPNWRYNYFNGTNTVGGELGSTRISDRGGPAAHSRLGSSGIQTVGAVTRQAKKGIEAAPGKLFIDKDRILSTIFKNHLSDGENLLECTKKPK